MMTKIGERVGVVLSVVKGEANFLGYGVYMGDKPCPTLGGMANPKLLLDDGSALDQFMVQNPDYFFGRSPEHGYVNPDNLFILLNHLKCAAFELPLREDEKFGSLDLRRLCRHLEEVGFLHHTTDGWHWVSESYPADAISLRSVSSDNFVIVDNDRRTQGDRRNRFFQRLTTLHEKAIYFRMANSTTSSASTMTTAKLTSTRFRASISPTPSPIRKSRSWKHSARRPPARPARIMARCK